MTSSNTSWDTVLPWKSVMLPYFASTEPAITLPSAEEIRGCTNVLHERFRAKIVAVTEQIVAKFGGNVLERNGQALIYLERDVPKVPAPRLYAMYYHEDELFLVMQRAPGVQLEKLWPFLTGLEKQSIVIKLQDIFEKLKAQFWEEHLGKVLRDLRPTLTHGDVQRRNIVVAERTDCTVEGGQRIFDVFLVDWEMAGWLPRFWEFFIVSKRYHFTDLDEDWWLHLGKFLDVRLGEAATLSTFEQDYS